MTLFLPSIPLVVIDLETTEAKVDLAVALYMLMLGTAPVVWAAVSDRYGRKFLLATGLGIHAVTSVACGFSWNVEALICFRVLQSIGVSSLLVVGAGVVADIYPPEVRGNALGWFTMAPAVGPLFGPLVGGAVAELLGWRWIFWGSAILGAFFCCTSAFLLPETHPRSYQPATPYTEEEDRKWSLITVIRPFQLLLDPRVAAMSLGNGFCQSTTLGVLVIFPITLSSTFNLDAMYIGLCYLPYGLCALVGSSLGGRLSDLVANKYGPSARLLTAICGIFCYGLSGLLFIFVDTFALILTATGLLGFFFCFQRPGVYSFLIQNYPGDSSGVSASVLFIQYTLGFLATMIGPQVWNTPDGKFWFFMAYAIATFLSTIPIGYFVKQSWKVPHHGQD
eukprot:TRINITY_DN2159_c0_g1_i3.p1 TRINITY_DN2159_c0_g1~~TRINITY_DN2159_c0_g1_i3.p1  ORF type:complete len:393 (+),score=61.45 TRINITY_DN2159_c0_g1_i3:157-1335(+)